MPAASAPRAIDSVLFDIDGTLVDSNDAHARAWVAAFAEFGRDVAFTSVRPLIGMGSDKLLQTLATGVEAGTDAGKALTERRKAIFLERYVGAVRGLPGARELLARLKDGGLTCIVVSGSSTAELDPLLDAAGVTDLIDHIVRADEIDGSKPDPDVMGAALAWRGVPADRAVAVGDTVFDNAAHAAGVCCIALRCGGSPPSALAAADACFDTPLDFAQRLCESTLEALLRSRRSPFAPPIRGLADARG